MKKFLSMLLCLALLLTVVPFGVFTVGAASNTVFDTWDGTLATAFESGTGTAEDPYIIATAEQLAYAALGAPEVSNGKYFKVVDNATFDLDGMQDITLESTVGDVKTATTTNKNWRTANDGAKSFSGCFDGNGVVIYNMYSSGFAYSGLFPHATTDNTAKTGVIKNITLLNSRSNGYHYSGGIVGQYAAATTAQSVTIENCKVSNCWISDNGNTNGACNRTSGIIAGSVTHNNTKIKNCFAIDNITDATDITGGMVGNTSPYCPGIMVESCIVIGSLPYAVKVGDKTLHPSAVNAGNYSGVYTDQEVDTAKYDASQVKQLSIENMKGAAARSEMTGLDWSNWIAFDGELPDFRGNHTLTIGAGDAAGHAVSCTDCGKSMQEAHNFVENAEGTVGTCVCGYSSPITERRTDVWDGTKDSNFAAGTGTKNDPYIIKTAEQLAYVALDTKFDSKGKYFKVAPNMVFNMGGMSGITLDSTAEDVKNAQVGKNWANDARTFAGNFDGNGVIVYNIYSKGVYCGLFPSINTDNDDVTVTIKNTTVMASRFNGYHYSAGIIGYANAGTTNQFLNVENCAVKNCFMSDNNDKNPLCHRTAAAIIGSVTHNETNVSNCYAVDNIITATDISGGFIGNCSKYGNGVTINNSVIIGSKAYPELQATSSGDNKIVESIVIDPSAFTNVYTDQAVSGYGINQIRTLMLEQLSGVNAPQNTELDFGKYWFANEGLLDLLVCHNFESLVDNIDNYSGHTVVCKECSLSGIVTIKHKYNENYTCTDCGFSCDHQNDEYITITEFTDPDCITPPHTKVECACGYTERYDHDVCDGHKFVKTEAKAPTCVQSGNVEYYTCQKCECIFLTDDVMASYDVAVTEKDVILNATCKHTVLTDSNNNLIYIMDADSHWNWCAVCGTKLNIQEHVAEKNDTRCQVCLYKDDHTNHNMIKVEAVESTCSKMGNIEHWICTDCDKYFLKKENAAYLKGDVELHMTKIATKAHSYTNGVCIACGHIESDVVIWEGANSINNINSIQFASGTGTANDPFIITNGDQLLKMVYTGGKMSGATAYYKLAANIYLNDISNYDKWGTDNFDMSTLNNWNEPTINYYTQFAGNFDGDGYYIYGLYSVGASFAAFLPAVSSGSAVKNVHFRNSYCVNIKENPEIDRNDPNVDIAYISDREGYNQGQDVTSGGRTWNDMRYGTASVIAGYCEGSLAVNNCSVRYAYVKASAFASAIIGSTTSGYSTVKNCLIADVTLKTSCKEEHAEGVSGAVVNICYGLANVSAIEDVIVVGEKVYDADNRDSMWNGYKLPTASFVYNIENVYSNVEHLHSVEHSVYGDLQYRDFDIYVLDDGDLKGFKAKESLNLNWNTNWIVIENDYPIPAKEYIAVTGDVNEDGAINNKDIGILMQYLNGWDVKINVDAADVNCDGNVNNKDYRILMQYIIGDDVQIGR